MDVQRQVEIKLNVEGDQVPVARRLLGLRDRDAKRFSVRFGEYRAGLGGAGELPLLATGTILRLRHGPDLADSTVKIRRSADGELPADRPPEDDGGRHRFRVEGDWSGASRKLSASAVTLFRHGLPAGAVRSPELAFGRAQVRFLRQANTLPIDLRAVEILPAIRARRWPAPALGGDRPVVAEEWVLDGLRFLELSIRAPEPEAETAQAVFAEQATRLGLALSDHPEPKTTRVLRHLTGQG